MLLNFLLRTQDQNLQCPSIHNKTHAYCPHTQIIQNLIKLYYLLYHVANQVDKIH